MRYLAALLFLVGTIQITKAAPVAYEGFDYGAGKNLNGLNGGTGFKDAWHVDEYTYVIADEGMKDPSKSLSVSGKALRHTGEQPRARRNVNQLLGAPGTTIYLSFILRFDERDGFGGLILGGSNTSESFGVSGLYVGRGLHNYCLGSAGHADTEVNSKTPVVIGKPAFLVVRIDFRDGPDKATLFVNPTPGGPEPAHGIDYMETDLGQFSQLAITHGFGSTWTTDEIRVATTWNEVTPKMQSKFVTVSLRAAVNNRLDWIPINETGTKPLGGVPFDLLSSSDKNVWDSAFGTVPGVRSTQTLTLPVNIYGAANVYTLINTACGVEGSTTVSLSFVCSDGMKHAVTLKSGENIRDWFKEGYTNTIDERSNQEVINFKNGRIDKQHIELPNGFAERTLTKIILTDSGVTGKDVDGFNKRVGAQRAFLLGLTVETANDSPNQSPPVFDALTEKLLDETISKLKGSRAKQVSELKQKYKHNAGVLAAQRTDLDDEMQRAVLKVIVLPGDKANEDSQVESETLKTVDDAIEKAGEESDSTLAMPQCKNAVLAAVDKNNVWDEETRNRQFEIIYSAPPEKRKRLVDLYSKYEPKFSAQIQRELANVEQYKKDLLEIIAPDTGNEK